MDHFIIQLVFLTHHTKSLRRPAVCFRIDLLDYVITIKKQKDPIKKVKNANKTKNIMSHYCLDKKDDKKIVSYMERIRNTFIELFVVRN